jgi:hypothetical protein
MEYNHSEDSECITELDEADFQKYELDDIDDTFYKFEGKVYELEWEILEILLNRK